MTKEVRLLILRARKIVLAERGRDNGNIIKKIDREIRALTTAV